MTRTGTQIVTKALREIGVLDPVEAASGEQLADGLDAANELLDSWRTERLTIGGVTMSTYSLASGQASRTIGVGGNFNQVWPQAIQSWSVIPDDDAAHPLEIPMGRPLNAAEWQQIRQKTQTGPRPSSMHYDQSYAAGLGICYFHPIPDNNDVDVKLYESVPVLTELVAATSYDLRPGQTRALTLQLALELADRYGKPVTDRLERRAARAFGLFKRSNIVPKESPIRGEFVIGHGRTRSFNVRTGG